MLKVKPLNGAIVKFLNVEVGKFLLRSFPTLENG
jgi:hypothetical protein